MAVYRRRYQATSADLTGRRFRFLVFTRYAFRDLFHMRLFALYFTFCFAAPLVGAVIIYLHFNPLGLKVLQTTVQELIPIDARFFLRFLIIQTGLGSLLTAVVGPGLVAPDLANNALPLYFSRPISRNQYILGKLTVLIGLLSLLTWIPLMLLFVMQCGLSGWSWFTGNLDIATAILCCSALWILVVSLLTLAISAWVRWRPIATLSVFGFFFVSAAIGSFIEETLHASWGNLINVGKLMRLLWGGFFGFTIRENALSPEVSSLALILWCLLFLAMLRRRVRAFEVVRS